MSRQRRTLEDFEAERQQVNNGQPDTTVVEAPRQEGKTYIMPLCDPTPMPPAIAKAVNQIMKRVKRLGKTVKNQYDNYDAVPIDDFLALTRPLLAEAGLIIYPIQLNCDIKWSSDGRGADFVLFEYAFRLVHVDGESWVDPKEKKSVPFSKTRISPQLSGMADSYALKQYERVLFQIECGEPDVDEVIGSGTSERSEREPKQEQRQTMEVEAVDAPRRRGRPPKAPKSLEEELGDKLPDFGVPPSATPPVTPPNAIGTPTLETVVETNFDGQVIRMQLSRLEAAVNARCHGEIAMHWDEDKKNIAACKMLRIADSDAADRIWNVLHDRQRLMSA